MENSLLNHIESYAKFASQSFNWFAGFVNEMEFFAEQNESIFSDEMMQQYNSIWMKLEVLNACALEEWESLGKKQDFSKLWDVKYKEDVSALLTELLSFLKICMNKHNTD